MKISFSVLAGLVAVASSNPLPLRAEYALAKRQIFTDLTCSLSQAITPGTPLVFLFPTANELGTIVGPVLKGLIGADNLERIDDVADFLCVNSQWEPPGERGICAEALQAIKDIALAITPLGQAHKYRCLLNLLCVANAGTVDGTCQYLLAGADCVANRIIQGKDLECEGDM